MNKIPFAYPESESSGSVAPGSDEAFVLTPGVLAYCIVVDPDVIGARLKVGVWTIGTNAPGGLVRIAGAATQRAAADVVPS